MAYIMTEILTHQAEEQHRCKTKLASEKYHKWEADCIKSGKREWVRINDRTLVLKEVKKDN